MLHFKFLGSLDTFAVTATLLKHKSLFDSVDDVLMILGLDGGTTFDKWKSLSRLIGQVAMAAKGDLGEVWINRLQPGTATDFTCDVNPQYLTFIVPLVTNPYVREYAREEAVHAPVGALLWANAGVHRASANWGEFPRYHLNVQIKEGVKA